MSLAPSNTYTIQENAFEDENSYIAVLNQHTIQKNVFAIAGNSHHIYSNSKATTSVGNSQSFMNVWHGRLGYSNKLFYKKLYLKFMIKCLLMQLLNFAKLVNMVNSIRMCFLRLILYIPQDPFK